jgi:DNA-binding NarL/FixJ family response regulator
MLVPAECPPIRVLIADDHEVVRLGIARLLESRPGIEVVGLARDGAEAIAMCAELAPDVVLMDLEMPGVDGIEATQRIARPDGGPSVVILTSFADRDHISEAIDSGAAGYLLKDAESDELVAAVRAAAAGESPLTPRVALTVVKELRTGGGGASETLSDREREVLALVAAGVPNKLIALRLGISSKTVKSHLSHIFRRIGVGDRLQAAMWARRHGLVEEPDDTSH